MSDRLPVTERAENPPNMRLTGRDRRVVMAVYTHRMLTRDQIKRLIFEKPGLKPGSIEYSSKKRLKLLYHHEFLERKPLTVRSTGPGQPPLVYFLDERGANLVAEELGVGRDEVDWKPKRNEVKYLFLEHTLRLNDVRIAIERAASDHGFTLTRWVDEGTFDSMQVRVPDPKRPRKTLPFRPDGFFTLDLGEKMGGKKAMFFVELDRATMTRSRFGKKIRAYQSYRFSGKSDEQFGHASSGC